MNRIKLLNHDSFGSTDIYGAQLLNSWVSFAQKKHGNSVIIYTLDHIIVLSKHGPIKGF